MYDSGPSHLEVAQRLLREDPAMGVNAFCDEYKRITGDCITRSNLRQWFGLNAASIRRGFLDESLSSHAAGMVIANPQLGHRLLMTQPASRPGSRPPERSWVPGYAKTVMPSWRLRLLWSSVNRSCRRTLLPCCLD